jgi:YVTN family beta-propeller protein
MTMKLLFRPLLLSLALTGFLAGCSNKDDTPAPSPAPAPAPTPTTPAPTPGPTGQYAFVINEGNFTSGTGSVSRFDKNSKALIPDIFASANRNAVLGSVVQSMTVVDTLGYVVVNNSNKIEVVSLPSFKSKATINKLNQPRYLTRSVANPSKAYVTEWLGGPFPAAYTEGRVSVLDLTTNKVTGTIAVGINPGKAVLLNGSLYVPNSGSAFLTVINEASGATSQISLPTPASEVVADKNGALWILCSTDYVTQPAKLVKYNPATGTQQFFSFPAVGSGGGLRISPDGQQLYYSYNAAEYRLNITDTALPAAPLINRDFYGFDIDPTTGQLYGTDALDYAKPGLLVRYQPNGTLIDETTVKVSPNGVVFY